MRYLIPLLAAATCAVFGQKVETQPSDRKNILRIDTARDHLTVIELVDPVTMVAVGNPNAFSVERRENKVFLKPLDEGAKTNLFIWTATARYAYELVPAPTVEQMHFAIDQAPVLVSNTANSSTEANEPGPRLPAEMLTKAKPIPLRGDRDSEGRIEVTLHELFCRDGRVYLRYSMTNRTTTGYQATRPAAWRLSGVRAPVSLVPLGESQLSERLARSVKSDSAVPLEVLDSDQVSFLSPGEAGLGFLALPETTGAETDEPTILRLDFAADAKGAVEAFLLLKPVVRREVTNAKRAVE